MFDKKNADYVLRLFNTLSDAEREKFLDYLRDAEDEDEDTEDEADSAEKKISDEKKVDQTISDRTDETVAAEEKEDGDEDTQNAKDRIDEAKGAKKADEEEAERDAEDKQKKDEVYDALLARLTSLEETVGKLVRFFSEDPREIGGPFGNARPSPMMNADAGMTDDDRIMRNYYAKQGYRR